MGKLALLGVVAGLIISLVSVVLALHERVLDAYDVSLPTLVWVVSFAATLCLVVVLLMLAVFVAFEFRYPPSTDIVDHLPTPESPRVRVARGGLRILRRIERHGGAMSIPLLVQELRQLHRTRRQRIYSAIATLTAVEFVAVEPDGDVKRPNSVVALTDRGRDELANAKDEALDRDLS